MTHIAPLSPLSTAVVVAVVLVVTALHLHAFASLLRFIGTAHFLIAVSCARVCARFLLGYH